MSQPFEIVAQPFTLWVAAPGSAFPTIDEAPGGSWTKIGTSGDLNYTEDGVKISHKQKVENFRALGSTGPRKAFRTEEDLMISLTVVDITLEQYRIAMNGNAITTTAQGVGESGYKKLGLSRGLNVEQYALLIRGANASGYMEDGVTQYEVPIAVQVSEPEVAFVKGSPAGLNLEFQALEDPDAASDDERFGRLVMQNTEPGT